MFLSHSTSFWSFLAFCKDYLVISGDCCWQCLNFSSGSPRPRAPMSSCYSSLRSWGCTSCKSWQVLSSPMSSSCLLSEHCWDFDLTIIWSSLKFWAIENQPKTDPILGSSLRFKHFIKVLRDDPDLDKYVQVHGGADEDEHAPGVQSHHYRGSRRPSV